MPYLTRHAKKVVNGSVIGAGLSKSVLTRHAKGVINASVIGALTRHAKLASAYIAYSKTVDGGYIAGSVTVTPAIERYYSRNFTKQTGSFKVYLSRGTCPNEGGAALYTSQTVSELYIPSSGFSTTVANPITACLADYYIAVSRTTDGGYIANVLQARTPPDYTKKTGQVIYIGSEYYASDKYTNATVYVPTGIPINVTVPKVGFTYTSNKDFGSTSGTIERV